MLGSGSGTPARFRELNESALRRSFKPLPGDVGGEPCDKINFKVFDFSNGTLLWEKMTHNPQVATDGTVYHEHLTAMDQCVILNHFPYSSGDTLELDPIDNYGLLTRYEMRMERLDSTGATLSLSPVMGFRLSVTTAGIVDSLSLRASYYRINDDGDAVASLTMHGWQFAMAKLSDTVVRYYFLKTYHTTGDVTLTMDSEGTAAAHSDAVFDVTDSAATIESTISSAFGANVVSVSATGASMDTQTVVVDIEWASSDEYLASVEWPAKDTGTLYRLVNFRTGIYQPAGLSAGSGLNPIWQDNGDLLIVNGNSIQSLDVSAEPWVEQWSDVPRLGWRGKDGNFESLSNVSWGSKNGTCFITFERGAGDTSPAAGWPPGLSDNVATWAMYDDDGNEPYVHTVDHDKYNISYNTWGGLANRYFPDYAAVRDDGTEIMISHSNAVERFWYYNNSGGFQLVDFEVPGQTSAQQCRLYADDTDTPTYEVCRGDYTSDLQARAAVGCTGSHVAFCNFIAKANWSPEALCAYESKETPFDNNAPDTYVSEGFLTGVLHSVHVYEIRWFDTVWQINTTNHARASSGTKWRLRVQGANTVAGFDEHTKWFTESATIAELNTELDTVYGRDGSGDPLFEATAADPGDYVQTLPLWLMNLRLTTHMAKTHQDEYDELGLPEYLSSDASTPIFIRQDTPRVSLEFQDFAPIRETQFGSMAWSDGSDAWSRNFAPGSRWTSILGAQLHDGNLYVLSTKQCAEGSYAS